MYDHDNNAVKIKELKKMRNRACLKWKLSN